MNETTISFKETKLFYNLLASVADTYDKAEYVFFVDKGFLSKLHEKEQYKGVMRPSF